MLSTVALFALALGAFMLAARIFKKRLPKSGSQPSPLDVWLEGEAARLLAAKLSLDEAFVLQTLGGDPDPEIVTALERGTHKVEILFERVPGALGGQAADVTLEIAFEDGSLSRRSRRAPFAEIPSSVRDELARTGSARAYRPYVFAWQR